MATFLDMLKAGHPDLRKPTPDLARIRFADIQYGVRDVALNAVTRDVGKPLSKETFNDYCHGRYSVEKIIDLIQAY